MNFPIVASRYNYVNVFFNQLAPLVVNEYIRRKGQKRLFPSTVLAMAALESGYNLNAETLFGIKGDGIVLDTTEYINGEYVNIKDSFKAYPTIAASVQGLYDLMQIVRYKPACDCTDYEEECRMIQACGYATDPDYSDKLINIVNSYQLTMFNNIDEPTEEPDEPTEEPDEPTDSYTVQAGDNLWQIVARRYHLDNNTAIYNKMTEIAALNGIDNPSLIYPGMFINFN